MPTITLTRNVADCERVRTQPCPAYNDANAWGIYMRRLQLIVAPSFDTVSGWNLRQCRWSSRRTRRFQAPLATCEVLGLAKPPLGILPKEPLARSEPLLYR